MRSWCVTTKRSPRQADQREVVAVEHLVGAMDDRRPGGVVVDVARPQQLDAVETLERLAEDVADVRHDQHPQPDPAGPCQRGDQLDHVHLRPGDVLPQAARVDRDAELAERPAGDEQRALERADGALRDRVDGRVVVRVALRDDLLVLLLELRTRRSSTSPRW